MIAVEEPILPDREDHPGRWPTLVPVIPEQSQSRLIAQLTDTSHRFPWMRVILGHMGRTLPFFLWRLDQRAPARRLGGRAEGPDLPPRAGGRVR
jgi:predicted TIM-barrel fold metal-dependent hydrolase